MNVNEILLHINQHLNQKITLDGYLVYDNKTKNLFITSSKVSFFDTKIYVKTIGDLNEEVFEKSASIFSMHNDNRESFLEHFRHGNLPNMWGALAYVLYELATGGVETALEILHKLDKEDMLADLYDPPGFTRSSIKPNFLTGGHARDFTQWIQDDIRDYRIVNAQVTGYLQVNHSGEYTLALQQVLLKKGNSSGIISIGENNLDLAEIGDFPKLHVRELYKRFEQFEGKAVRLEGFLVRKSRNRGRKSRSKINLEGFLVRKPRNRGRKSRRKINNEPILLVPNYLYRRVRKPRTALHISHEEISDFKYLFPPLFNRIYSIAERVQIVGTPTKYPNGIKLTNIESVATKRGLIRWISHS